MNATERKPQRATLPSEDVNNAKNLHGDKETIETRDLVAFDMKRRKMLTAEGKPRPSDGFAEVVSARWYMGRSSQASTVFCSIWVRTRDGQHWYGGHGSAGGYGYCKSSAAFDEAVTSAGITLENSTHGVGMSAVDEAMHAIACAAGYSRTPRTIV